MTTQTIATPVITPADMLRAAAADPVQAAVIGFLAKYNNPKTREAFEFDLKVFHQWCQTAGITMLEPKRMHLELWLRSMQAETSTKTGRPLAQATISRRFGTVANFLKYAELDGLIEKNWAPHITRPRVDKEAQRRTWLTIGDFTLLVKTARTSTPQDSAMIVLLAELGLRVNELCQLNVGSLHVQRGHAYLEFRRKGGKLAQPDLPTDVLLQLQKLTGDSGPDEPMFLLGNGKRMTRTGVDRVIKRLMKQAGISSDLTPHGMRRSCATTALQIGASLTDVQLMLGHSDSRTTMLYNRRVNGGSTARHAVASLLAEAG